MDKIGSDSFFLVLASLVHQAKKRVDTELHCSIQIALFCYLQEVELGIQLGLEVNLPEVLVQEFEEDQDTIGVN